VVLRNDVSKATTIKNDATNDPFSRALIRLRDHERKEFNGRYPPNLQEVTTETNPIKISNKNHEDISANQKRKYPTEITTITTDIPIQKRICNRNEDPKFNDINVIADFVLF
jgi:hypothetical protein